MAQTQVVGSFVRRLIVNVWQWGIIYEHRKGWYKIKLLGKTKENKFIPETMYESSALISARGVNLWTYGTIPWNGTEECPCGTYYWEFRHYHGGDRDKYVNNFPLEEVPDCVRMKAVPVIVEHNLTIG